MSKNQNFGTCAGIQKVNDKHLTLDLMEGLIIHIHSPIIK